MPRFDVTTYGEGVIRLSVPAGLRIETADQFDVNVSGAEANVVGALSRLGWKTGWVSSLPDTPPGRRVSHAYRTHGIDLSSVVWRPEGRVSCYYVEYAHPPRPVKVYYDRKDSCFTNTGPDDIDWGYLLDTRHIHLSGLAVPLCEHSRTIVSRALERARDKGVTTSFDVNYRHLLWPIDDARETLLALSKGVDLLFTSRRDAETLFGCSGSPEEILAQMQEITGARTVVVTLSSDGVIGGTAGETHQVAAAPVTIVDRIGAGDAMVAGCLHGWLQDDLLLGLQSGAVMAALAMSLIGDVVITHRREVNRLLKEEFSDIVR